MATLTVTDGFKYDVFLSFRGVDTRHGFTSYLKKALDEKEVRTFMDDNELQKGDEITPSLLKAIEESMMAIVVLSENYASSSFCLQELSKILDTMKDKVGRSVWPVFYKVDPSDVRKLKRSYGEAMAKYDEASTNLDKWKVSLRQVANLSGFHYKEDKPEHKFIGEIVGEVLKNIKHVALPVIGDDLVGLEHQKQRITSLLNVGSDDTIHMVGIHGIGGIGKTTLAQSVYNSIADRFEGLCCFLENIKENSEKHGLLRYIQKILLSEIVGDKNIKIPSVKQGITIIQQRLRKKKVLLLLDDVDKDEQLHAIAGSPDWFGLGSRVIITTRNIRLLTFHGVQKYEVKGLNDEDAFDLVGRKALRDKYRPSYKDALLVQKYGRKLDVNELRRLKDLKNDKVFSCYANVLKRAVAYACGLPLALEVIGSHFFMKSIEDCESALDRYERIPDKRIQTTLQLSYEALHVDEKSVFLDIACCFKGYKLTTVEQILHAHYGDIKKDHISVLSEKSLIKISESGNVTLHDLVEDMGKEIVRQESPKDPGKRSRLCECEDIKAVLEENKGTSEIEMIHFGCSIEVEWDGEAFKKMENLKTLIFSNTVTFSKYPKHLPNSLRVLECRYPSSDHPDILFCSYILGHCPPPLNPFEWEGFLTKKFQNMRVLNIYNSHLLEQIPDISGFLCNLKILRVVKCPKIRMIPSLMLPSLEELDLSDCIGLECFPHVVYGFGHELKIMNVRGCINLKSIPHLKLTSLEELDLSDCTGLESFPPLVDGFGHKLKTMSIRGCIKLRSIPPLKLDSLETLDLSYCYSLESFPLVVDGLWKLVLDDCKELQEIKVIPPCLRMLSALNCKSLTSSCISKLLNQELHEVGNTWFRLPQTKIPAWFDYQCEAGLSIPFWFRNKFPAIALCVLSPLTWYRSQPRVRVIINGNKFFYTHDSKIGSKSHADTYHLDLFDMQMENFNDNMDKALLENKWNRAEVDFGFEFLKSGIHVLKEKSSMKDIRFTNPEN